MNKRIYTTNDLNYMDWVELGETLDILIGKLDIYQKENRINFDIVAPILRSGGVPATAIANRFKIMRFLPVQIKYTCDKDGSSKVEHKQLLSLPEILQETPKNPNILICETNTGTGESAKLSVSLLKENYPDSKIYYATVAKVYGGPDELAHVEKYFWGVQTNEFFKAEEDEERHLGLRPKITIFPWETAEFELNDINSG